MTANIVVGTPLSLPTNRRLQGTLVLVRHGETEWNREGRLTGWDDQRLNDCGITQAAATGRALAAAGLVFDVVFTSMLQRAMHTSTILLEAFGPRPGEIASDWRLNERHYGVLQGHNRVSASDHFGNRLARHWRRDIDARPPPVSPLDPRHPGRDSRYRDVSPGFLPTSESLRDVIVRVLDVWHHRVIGHLVQDRTVLVVAHTNTIRSLVHHLEEIAPEALIDLAIPAATPLVYRLGKDPCRPVSKDVLRGGAMASSSWAE